MTEPASFLPWHLGRLAVIDTETTGLSPELGDRVIEVAVVCFEQGEVVRRWSTLLDPGVPLPAETVRITGITDADVRGKPTFGAVVAEIEELLRDRVPVAYNADFDRKFLAHEFARCGAQLPPHDWLDPLVIARQLQQRTSEVRLGMKLGQVAQRLGIPLEEAHRAEADAECAGRVLVALVKGAQLPNDLADMLELQERWAAQEPKRGAWRARKDGDLLAAKYDGAANELGAAYSLSNELDPWRYLVLRAAGRPA